MNTKKKAKGLLCYSVCLFKYFNISFKCYKVLIKEPLEEHFSRTVTMNTQFSQPYTVETGYNDIAYNDTSVIATKWQGPGQISI